MPWDQELSKGTGAFSASLGHVAWTESGWIAVRQVHAFGNGRCPLSTLVVNSAAREGLQNWRGRTRILATDRSRTASVTTIPPSAWASFARCTPLDPSQPRLRVSPYLNSPVRSITRPCSKKAHRLRHSPKHTIHEKKAADDSCRVWRSSLILSAWSCYLMWAITFLAQWHPLINPRRSDLRPEGGEGHNVLF